MVAQLGQPESGKLDFCVSPQCRNLKMHFCQMKQTLTLARTPKDNLFGERANYLLSSLQLTSSWIVPDDRSMGKTLHQIGLGLNSEINSRPAAISDCILAQGLFLPKHGYLHQHYGYDLVIVLNAWLGSQPEFPTESGPKKLAQQTTCLLSKQMVMRDCWTEVVFFAPQQSWTPQVAAHSILWEASVPILPNFMWSALAMVWISLVSTLWNGLAVLEQVEADHQNSSTPRHTALQEC